LALEYVKEQTQDICNVINNQTDFYWNGGDIKYMKPKYQKPLWKNIN
jgi:hypothetical protein